MIAEYLKSLRNVLLFLPVLFAITLSLYSEIIKLNKATADLERTVVAHFLLGLQAGQSFPSDRHVVYGDSLDSNHPSWTAYFEHSQSGEIAALAFRNLQSPRNVDRRALLPGIGWVYFRCFSGQPASVDSNVVVRYIRKEMILSTSDSCASYTGHSRADLFGSLFRQMVHVQADPDSLTPLFGDGYDLLFDNIEREWDSVHSVMCLVPGETRVSGIRGDPFFVEERLSQADLVDYGSRVSRSTGILSTDIYNSYFTLRSQVENKRVTVPLLNVDVPIPLALSALQGLSIAVLCWASILIRAALTCSHVVPVGPSILVTPYLTKSKRKGIVEWLDEGEASVFLLLHITCFISPIGTACVSMFLSYNSQSQSAIMASGLTTIIVLIISMRAGIQFWDLVDRMRRESMSAA